MLNELFALQRGLAASGEMIGASHPDINIMAKSGAIRVRLQNDGALANIEVVPQGVRGAPWTLRDGNKNSFPGLKLPGLKGVARATHDTAWSAAGSGSAKRAELLRLLAERESDEVVCAWPTTAHRKRIAERLDQLETLKHDPLTASVQAVFVRFLKAVSLHQPFAHALFKALSLRLAEDEIWLGPIRGTLIGSMALAIDTAHGDFVRDVGDSRQISAVSAALQRSDNGQDALHVGGGRCALSGLAGGLLEGPFPHPNLRGLGPTPLFARNKDIPALARYNRIGTASLPISAELVSRLSGAIMAVTEVERRGKTWRLIPSESGDKQDLFVASLAADASFALVDALATEDDVTGWAAIESATEGILRHFKGLAASVSPQEDVRLLVLRTIDKGNRKAVCDRRATVEQLHAAAIRWDSAMRNVPGRASFLIGTKKGAVVRSPPILPPLSLIRVTRNLFVSGGSRRVDVVGLPASEALALFFNDKGAEARALRILSMLIKRQQPLIAGLTHAAARGRVALKAFDPTNDMELRRDSLGSMAWLGALLHILGRTKEIYMTDTAFKLGQLLSAADAMHIGYCADLRGGSVPPTLLGNAVFAIAGRDPIRALDVLQGRWKPYGAWACRTDHVHRKAAQLQGGKDDQLAWNMRRGISQARLAGPLCAELQAAIPTVQVNDRFRAELLLGYVAGIEREPKTESDKRSTKDDGKEIAA